MLEKKKKKKGEGTKIFFHKGRLPNGAAHLKSVLYITSIPSPTELFILLLFR